MRRGADWLILLVVVMSNIPHANTSALGLRVGETFAELAR